MKPGQLQVQHWSRVPDAGWVQKSITEAETAFTPDTVTRRKARVTYGIQKSFSTVVKSTRIWATRSSMISQRSRAESRATLSIGVVLFRKNLVDYR